MRASPSAYGQVAAASIRWSAPRQRAQSVAIDGVTQPIRLEEAILKLPIGPRQAGDRGGLARAARACRPPPQLERGRRTSRRQGTVHIVMPRDRWDAVSRRAAHRSGDSLWGVVVGARSDRARARPQSLSAAEVAPTGFLSGSGPHAGADSGCGDRRRPGCSSRLRKKFSDDYRATASSTSGR